MTLSAKLAALRGLRRLSQLSPQSHITNVIRAGENDNREFKSTLRWDLQTKSKNPALTLACIKVGAAFLNTDGGDLLIGIADDGAPVGIERDGFGNDDKFLLHLHTLLNQHLGTAAIRYVRSEIHAYHGVRVCLVRCKRAHEPVVAKGLATNEEFYVRAGPSCKKLAASEMLTYIASRFD